VDDLIVGGDNEEEIEHVKSLLKQKFDIKDLGELRYFLGIEVISMHWTYYPSMVWLAISPSLYHWMRMAS